MTSLKSEALKLKVSSWKEWPRIAPVWTDLFHSGNFSFFLSVEWVDTWISVFGPSLRPSILVFCAGEQIRGACLVVETKIRQGFVPITRISLNTSGERAAEATYPEFNDVLCRPGAEREIAQALAGYLAERDWDELMLDGFEPGTVFDSLREEMPNLHWGEDVRPSHYVDLSAVRTAGGLFESVLGKTTRKHLRQNKRHFSEASPLVIDAAQSLDAALSMFEEMALLNRRRRELRGYQSVFAAERFLDFHRRLIRRCFCDNTVKLFRVSSGTQMLGTVYLFETHGKVYFYQCGFDFGNDARWSPGTVTLAEVIQHCVTQGCEEFDFLATDAGYKRRLSNGVRSLVWAYGRQPTTKMNVIHRLRQLNRLRRAAMNDRESS